MSKKKLIILCGIGLFLIFVVVIFFIISNKPTVRSQPTIPPTISPAQVWVSPKKIDISGIQTNDFLSNPIKTNSQGDVLFVNTTDYQITYLRGFNQFVINISTSSAGIRDNAESGFLKKLGISKDDACRLNVFVSAPYVPNPYLSVQARTLSFCVSY